MKNPDSNSRIITTLFGNYSDHMEAKIKSIGFFYFSPQILIIILNIRDLGENYTQKSGHIVKILYGLQDASSKKAIDNLFVMS